MYILNGDKKVQFNGKTYGLHSVSGKVMDTNTRSETEVTGSGGGGGGFSYQGTGASSTRAIRITSTTTRFTKIFILGEDGVEHAAELVDFDVRCRAGNGLTLIWAIKEGKDKGPYIAAYNHSSRDMEFDEDVIGRLCRPTMVSMLAGSAIGFVLPLVMHWGGKASPLVAFVMLFVGMWVGMLVARMIGKQRAKAFIQGPDVSGMRAQLEAVPVAKLTQLTAA
ncbi:hypothetical protein [Phenylobacterium sp.]|uniref:hypothetical protein n=1 Tax=Phenylobacterium sp. TaxID=1871053 RepID=UPI0035B4DE1F